jgi:ribosome maturation factor RimP
MSETTIEKRIEAIARRVCAEYGIELVHVEMAGARRSTLRIIIDKPDGITHEDCAKVSHHVETILDVEDFIHSAYVLEVSSPGLEREMYKLSDYEKFAGNQSKMKTREPINGQRNFRGRIVGVENENILFDDRTNGIVSVPFAIIAKAHLEIDIEAEFRRAKEREKK